MRIPRHRGLLLGMALLLLAIVVTVGGRIVDPAAYSYDPKEALQYTTAGAAFLQKARDTGDPVYYTKADGAFAEALRRDPQNVDALIGQGTLALARHQFRQALALGQQAQALEPARALTYGVIGDAQVELGQYDQAAATVQQMIDHRPDLSSYSRVSYLRELHGDVDGAIHMMQEAVTSGSGQPENVEWVRVQLGNLYFNKGDLSSAEQLYQQSLYHLPGYVYALAGLGRVRAAQGQYPAAIAYYNQAIKQVPLPEFVIALGEVQQAAGPKGHPTADAAQQYDLVRFEERLFQANGVNTDLELALFEADHGDPQQALKQARLGYSTRPSIKGADTLAWALSQAGQQTEARQTIAQALRLGTRDALFYYHAGMIAQRQGDAAQARAWLTQALSINPYFSVLYAPEARRILASSSK